MSDVTLHHHSLRSHIRAAQRHHTLQWKRCNGQNTPPFAQVLLRFGMAVELPPLRLSRSLAD
uniref:Uncharacterized protein n=1 Tax=Anguilla anguilla TaxID=7936 RepID=A0A0E9WZG9_ANGAN